MQLFAGVRPVANPCNPGLHIGLSFERSDGAELTLELLDRVQPVELTMAGAAEEGFLIPFFHRQIPPDPSVVPSTGR
jgi:hypothetical protein